MAKYRRQPKAGELASRGSPRFALVPRAHAANNFAPAMLRAAPATEHEPTIYPADMRITYCPPAWARNAAPRKKSGGMMGGATGCCRGVTSNNGIGIVPAAFRK